MCFKEIIWPIFWILNWLYFSIECRYWSVNTTLPISVKGPLALPDEGGKMIMTDDDLPQIAGGFLPHCPTYQITTQLNAWNKTLQSCRLRCFGATNSQICCLQYRVLDIVALLNKSSLNTECLPLYALV